MARLVCVGNSLEICIPKSIISLVGFKEDTELEFKIVEDGLLIRPVQQKRARWNEAFKKPKGRVKETIPGEDIANQFDLDEWEW